MTQNEYFLLLGTFLVALYFVLSYLHKKGQAR